jgi:ABC-type glycerol-3-phosphate transport system substrate-binding protein
MPLASMGVSGRFFGGWTMKKFVLIIIALALVLGAAWAGGQPEQAKQKPSLTIMLHPVLYSATGGDGGLIKEFREKFGVDVEVVTAPLDGILEKTLLDFVSGTSSIDVFVYTDTALHAGLAKNLLPLDNYIKQAGSAYAFDDIIESAVSFSRFNGVTYGIPFRYGVYMLYYRADLFKKYGVAVPQTWTDLNAAAKTITEKLRAEGINDVYGIVFPGEAGQYLFEVYKTWLAGHGGMIAKNGKVTLNTPEAILALENLVLLYRNGWAPPDTPGKPVDQAIGAVQSGKAAMNLAYSPYWGLFTNPQSSAHADTMGWAMTPHAPGVPYGRASFSGWNMLINGKTRFPNEAWELVRYLTTKEASLHMALNFANGPIRKSVLTDPAYLAKFPLAADWLKSFQASEPLLPGGHEKISQIMDIIGREVSSALIGEKTPAQAMEAAQAKVTAIF